MAAMIWAMKNRRQLTPTELADLKAEMRRDGERMQAKLEAMRSAVPLKLPIWVSKTPYTPENRAERPADAS